MANNFEIKVDAKKKFEIQMGKNKIVGELCNYDGNHPEFCIFVTDEGGVILQDICLVRPHVVDIEQNTCDDRVDCLVWGDSENEDYTHKHVIDIYEFND